MEILRTSYDTHYRVPVLGMAIFVYRDCPDRPVLVVRNGDEHLSRNITRQEAASLLRSARLLGKL